MDFEPDHGVAMPVGRGYGFAFKIRKLKIGDSFLVKTEDLKTHTQNTILFIARRLDIQIMTRKREEGLRVWRIEKDELEAPKPKSKPKQSATKTTKKDLLAIEVPAGMSKGDAMLAQIFADAAEIKKVELTPKPEEQDNDLGYELIEEFP